MDIEEKEVKAPVEGEKAPEETPEQKPEEADSKKADGFEKDSDVVSAGKYNAAVRKQRELEFEKRELEAKLAQQSQVTPAKKAVAKEEEEEDDDEDFFKSEEPVNKGGLDIEALLDQKVKPLQARLDEREAEDRKKQRTAFFKLHPEYLASPEKWQELLDEMDNSLNPNSKDGHYKQLIKAHRLLAGEPVNTAIEKKKMELASEIGSYGAGAQKKSEKSQVDERAMRLASKMPKGYEFNK